MKPGTQTTGLLQSFGYALEGIAATARTRNFRIQLAIGVLACMLGAVFHISIVEWLIVIVCIGAVLSGECMNTALEALVDVASPDIHPLAKRAKDAAAGSVLIASIASFIIGVIIFLPRLLEVIL